MTEPEDLAETMLDGHEFVALRRLTTADGDTIAEVGETCERVPAAPGGTQSEALAKLMASGKIAPAPVKDPV